MGKVEMKVKPDTVIAIYEMLRNCEPFLKWKLPYYTSLEFRVNRDRDAFGEFESPNIIKVSSIMHNHLITLIKTVAHEMLHYHLYRKGFKAWDKHDFLFQRYSKQICEKLGFDNKEF